MQSIILSSLQAHHHATHASTTIHPQKINNRKRHAHLYLYISSSFIHPSILSSTYMFHHAKCKCILSSTRTGNHTLYPTSREHAGPNMQTHTFHPLACFSDDYESSSHTFDMQRKRCSICFLHTHPNIEIHPSPQHRNRHEETLSPKQTQRKREQQATPV